MSGLNKWIKLESKYENIKGDFYIFISEDICLNKLYVIEEIIN